MNEAFLTGFLKTCNAHGLTSAETGLALKIAAASLLEAAHPGIMKVVSTNIKDANLSLEQMTVAPVEIGDIPLRPLSPNVF